MGSSGITVVAAGTASALTALVPLEKPPREM